MITEKEIDKAVHWLAFNSEEAAMLRADRLYHEEYRKSLKAILMKEHDGPVSAQEREAYADQKYLFHLKELKNAVFKDERNKALRHSAEIKINAYQTQSANTRSNM